VGSETETLNYADMGFDDRRTGNPSQLWVILRTFALEKGTLPLPVRRAKEFLAIEKRIDRTKMALQKYFGLSGDPMPLIKETGYRARFKISLAPSSAT